ncbi:MAG TPA: tetratricopeptide repeat protein [Burkholderiaceae bacterium]|nr:tetratricopeptide repeat protein [Burkholderiaceae bacterium]
MSPSPVRKSLSACAAAIVFVLSGPVALAQPAQPLSAQDRELFPDEKPQEKGWKGLANMLESLEPEVDTSIPLTPSQITDRISAMLDQGRAAEALQVIEKRQAQYASNPDPLGADVQLMFLHARALAALQRHEEAIEIYRDMTTRYPELPEPWNNLAAEYVKTGRLQMARDALQMALHANPQYPDALRNLGRVQMLMAEESFRAAEQSGR